MRIRLHADGRNINLVLPTRMLFSKGSVRLMKFSARFIPDGTMEKIPMESLDVIFAELRRIKKKYGTWELVNVDSADGQKIEIIL